MTRLVTDMLGLCRHISCLSRIYDDMSRCKEARGRRGGGGVGGSMDKPAVMCIKSERRQFHLNGH